MSVICGTEKEKEQIADKTANVLERELEEILGASTTFSLTKELEQNRKRTLTLD